MKGSDLLLRCLENEGVQWVFGVPGEETLDVLNSLVDSQIRFIAVRHEQGAAFMADVHGRLTGKAGVCLSTLGPGATNLITGVADAYLDRTPLVAITGQASLDRKHKESHQFIDVLSMFKPVTKWNAEIFHPRTMAETVRKAFKVAQTEKPGSTHLELPEDVAAETGSDSELDGPLRVQAPHLSVPLARQVTRAVEALAQARRSILLVGNGVIRGQAHDAVRRFARQTNIPVVHTFMSKGIVPDSDPLSLYTIGLQMRDYPTVVMEQSDVVVAVGYDFVEYAPSLWNPNRDKHIVHVDVSPSEVDAHYYYGCRRIGRYRFISRSDRRTACFVRFGLGRRGPPARADRIRTGVGTAAWMAPTTSAYRSRYTIGAGAGGWPGCFPARCRTPASFPTDLRRWAWRCLGRFRPSSCSLCGASWL